MSNSENNHFGHALPVEPPPDLTFRKHTMSAIKTLDCPNPYAEYCPEGWDPNIEDYFRGKMFFKDEEDRLLDHLATCSHCAEHVALLELIYSSLAKTDFLKSIKQ